MKDNLPIDVVMGLVIMLETSDSWFVVFGEMLEVLEVGVPVLDVTKELERFPEAEVAELPLARANVDSLKQDTSLDTS